MLLMFADDTKLVISLHHKVMTYDIHGVSILILCGSWQIATYVQV